MNIQEFTFICSSDDFNEAVINIKFKNKNIGKVFLAHHLIIAETSGGKRLPVSSFQEAIMWLIGTYVNTNPVSNLPDPDNKQTQIF